MKPIDDQDFEQSLRELAPVRPSAAAASAVSARLETAGGRAARPRWPRSARIALAISWSVAAAATVTAVALLQEHRPRAESRISPESQVTPEAAATGTLPAVDGLRVRPVDANAILYAVREEGVVRLDDGTPARRVRLQYLDTLEMAAEGGAAGVAMSRPREEIRFIPINAY